METTREGSTTDDRVCPSWCFLPEPHPGAHQHMPPLSRSFSWYSLAVVVIVVGVLFAAGLALWVDSRRVHREEGELHTFTTGDGQTVEWSGDACFVVDGVTLVCGERG